MLVMVFFFIAFRWIHLSTLFFFQAEDGIRVHCVTGVQTCALPISTPIIMMTGWATLMKGEEDLPLHVDGVLNKPPKITELQETLRRVSQRRNGGVAP